MQIDGEKIMKEEEKRPLERVGIVKGGIALSGISDIDQTVLSRNKERT